MSKTKKILSIFLAILMIVSAIPMAFAADATYVASVTDKDGNLIGSYETIDAAVSSAKSNEGSTIKLLDNISRTTQLSVEEGSKFTLDLNGKTLESSAEYVLYIYGSSSDKTKTSITIEDSVGNGAIANTSTESVPVAVYAGYATVTLNSGTVKTSEKSASHGIDLLDSIFYMYGGTISGANIGVYNSGTFNMYGGTISGAGYGVKNSGTFNMYGGTISGYSSSVGRGVENSSGTFNMYGGTISGLYIGVSNFYGTFNMYGGTMAAKVFYEYNGECEVAVYCGYFPNYLLLYNDELTLDAILAEGSNYYNENSELMELTGKTEYYDSLLVSNPDSQFTVSFNSAEGTGEMASETVAAGKYILPECSFTPPENDSFLGWLVNGKKYNADDSIVVVCDTAVKAIWLNAHVCTDADGDNDHKCDYCDKDGMSDHIDANADNLCDVCKICNATIKDCDTYTVTKEEYVKFVPTVSGTYIISSTSSDIDPDVTLYDSAQNYIADSDDENGRDFCLEYKYTAGETYYFRFYDHSETYNYEVTLVHKTHSYDEIKSEANLTRPVLTDGTWSKGYYTHKCTVNANCTETEKEYVDRADYTAYDKAVATVASYLTNDSITDKAKANILTELKKYAEENADISVNENGKLKQDLIATEQNIVDTATKNAQELIDIVEAKIADGTIIKADYTSIDEVIEEIEQKIADNNVTDENKTELEAIKTALEALKDDANSSVADVTELMEKLDTYEEKLDAGIEDGTWVEKEETPDEPDTPDTPDEPDTPDDTTTDSDVCDTCGKVHANFFDNIICAIKRFFNKIVEFFKGLNS